MPEPKPLYPDEYRAIDWEQPPMAMIEEAKAESAAIQKYQRMLDDASFPAGTLVDAHA
jgi:hypothetical protein